MKSVVVFSAICHIVAVLSLAVAEPNSFMSEFLDRKYYKQTKLNEADVSLILCTIPECFGTTEVQGMKNILLKTDLQDQATNRTVTALFKKQTGSWLIMGVFWAAAAGAIITLIPIVLEL